MIHASTPILLALAAVPLLAGSAVAQPTNAPKGGVIKPPAHVDPGMQVKPKQPAAALPTPVVKPPPTIVPK